MNDEQVNDFWRWFTDFREDIAAAALSGNGEWLRKELTDRVLKMQAEGARPRLNWEISPGVSKRWRLAFSPMVKRNLKLTESIVAHAPEVSDWEFLSTKPPKPDRFTYRLQDEDGEIVRVNAENWTYALLEYPNSELLDVVLFPDFQIRLDENHKRKLGYLVIEGILGERLFIARIAEVKIMDPGASSDWPKTALKLLAREIASLPPIRELCD